MKPTWVRTNNEWIDIVNVEVTDCSEGMMGEDIVTFEYLGETYESRVVMGSKPG